MRFAMDADGLEQLEGGLANFRALGLSRLAPTSSKIGPNQVTTQCHVIAFKSSGRACRSTLQAFRLASTQAFSRQVILPFTISDERSRFIFAFRKWVSVDGAAISSLDLSVNVEGQQ